MIREWLKAAKSVSGKWILLKFVRETRTKSPYLPSKVTLLQLFVTSFWINLRSSSKRETDVLEITTFLPASDSLFGSRHIQNKVILRGVISSSISTRWEQGNFELGNPKTRCVNKSWWSGGGAALFKFRLSYIAFMWTIEDFRTAILFFD